MSINKTLRFIFITNVILIVLTCICAGIYGYLKYRYERDYKEKVDAITATMSYEDFSLLSGQTYYYADGSVMYSYQPEQKEKLETPADITDAIKDVTLAAEDIRFYEHGALDFKALARAVYVDVVNRSADQGASTITQQLVKLTYLTNEKSIDRKIIEAAVAYEVEERYSKDEILLAYLNKVYFGNGVYGIADASEYYFSKSYKDLTYDETATLIAIVNRPNALEPIKNPSANKGRRDRILATLGRETTGSTKLNINEAYANKYDIDSAGLDAINYIHSVYSSNSSENDEISDVYTTIDKDLQVTIGELVDELEEPLQASITVIDNKTGKIIAIDGGKSEGTELFGLNRAVDQPRQTGSTIKPLLDYGVAFDNYKIDTEFKVYDSTEGLSIKNSTGKTKGSMTIKQAVTNSVNTIAYRLYIYMTADGIIPLRYLEKMNFSHLAEEDYSASSVAIGGFTYGATTLEMAAGYATLANNGVYRTPTAIKDAEVSTVQVYKPIAAYLMTEAMSDVDESGTAKKLRCDASLSCKTGTTNNNKDAWLCGYTDDYTIAIWVGADNYNEKYAVKSSGEVLTLFQGVLDALELSGEDIYTEDEIEGIMADLEESDERNESKNLSDYFKDLIPKAPVPQPEVTDPAAPVPVVPETPVAPATPEVPATTQEVVPQQ